MEEQERGNDEGEGGRRKKEGDWSKDTGGRRKEEGRMTKEEE